MIAGGAQGAVGVERCVASQHFETFQALAVTGEAGLASETPRRSETARRRETAKFPVRFASERPTFPTRTIGSRKARKGVPYKTFCD
jgi:hypothetical protein